jgi:hypothetical protein
MILDCCHAATAARGHVSGINEILAASVRDAPSWSGWRAYSKLLRKKLEIMRERGRPFTVQELHEQVMKHSGPSSREDPDALIATPDHLFAAGSGTRSIRLDKLPRPGSIIKAKSESTSKNQRVFMEIELDSMEEMEPKSWQRWFTQRLIPPSMLGFKFHTEEGIYMKAIAENASLARR